MFPEETVECMLDDNRLRDVLFEFVIGELSERMLFDRLTDVMLKVEGEIQYALEEDREDIYDEQ
jgi:hypothetical protein